MFGKLRVCSLATMALMLTTIAHSGIGTRCWFIAYEPDIPKKLKSEV